VSVDKALAIQYARELAAQGRVDESIAECRKILQHFPEEAQVHLCVADLYLKNQCMREASEAYYQAAAFFYQNAELMNAASCYRQILKIDPYRPEVSVSLAEIHANRGQVNNAVADYLAAAKLYTHAEMPDKAIEVYERILGLNAKNTSVRLKMAELYLKQGRTQEAAEEYIRVAKEYERTQKESEARSLYESVLQQVPGHPEALRCLGRTGGPKSVETDESMPALRRKDTVPVDRGVTDRLTSVPRSTGFAESSSDNGSSNDDLTVDATPSGEMFVPDEPKDIEPTVVADGPLAESEVSYAAHEQDPGVNLALSDEVLEDLETQYELALAYKDMGLFNEAVETFEQSLVSPDRFTDACTMLAACYKDRQLNKAAIQWLERALRNPRSEGTLAVFVKHTLAQLYEAEGQPQKAAHLYASIPSIRQAAERVRSKETTHPSGMMPESSSSKPEKTRRISFF
jgi:tetratricopeptide (TPR) repeat protein